MHARGLWAGHGTLHSPSDGLAPSTKLADAPVQSAVRLGVCMRVAGSTWAERGGVVQSEYLVFVCCVCVCVESESVT